MERFEVVIVKRPTEPLSNSWRYVPRNAVPVRTLMTELERWAALALTRAFNEAERRQPYGVWAVPRRMAPRQSAKGAKTATG